MISLLVFFYKDNLCILNILMFLFSVNIAILSLTNFVSKENLNSIFRFGLYFGIIILPILLLGFLYNCLLV